MGRAEADEEDQKSEKPDVPDQGRDERGADAGLPLFEQKGGLDRMRAFEVNRQVPGGFIRADVCRQGFGHRG